MQGYRKILVVVIISSIAAVAAFFGVLTDQLAEVLTWLAGMIGVANAVEHVAGARKIGTAARQVAESAEDYREKIGGSA